VYFVKWQEWLGAGVVATYAGKQFIHNENNNGIVGPLCLSCVFIMVFHSSNYSMNFTLLSKQVE